MGVAVLSVDLAHRRWSDLGIVILSHVPDLTTPAEAPASGTPFAAPFHLVQPGPNLPAVPAPPLWRALDASPAPIHCQIISWNGPELDPGTELDPATGQLYRSVDPNVLAGRLNHLCSTRDIRILMLDGPQAWKSNHNGLAHARVSERELNTPTKTGLPGLVKPLTLRPFAEFCLDVYDALCRRGWRRLDAYEQPGQSPERVLVESYPHAAWRSLGIKPLPGKKRCKISDLAEAYAGLRKLMPISTDRPPNHDQLQAIVGGLAGLALEERNSTGARFIGRPPRREDGHWREGFIVLPVPPPRSPGMRWLH